MHQRVQLQSVHQLVPLLEHHLFSLLKQLGLCHLIIGLGAQHVVHLAQTGAQDLPGTSPGVGECLVTLPIVDEVFPGILGNLPVHQCQLRAGKFSVLAATGAGCIGGGAACMAQM